MIARKPIVSREVFGRLLPELRARAFLVSGLESLHTVQRVQDEIAAIPQGQTWDESKKNIVAALEPELGAGAERRAEILLRTHGFQAFQAANWRDAQLDGDTTHLQYISREDSRVRPTHAALNGLILPKDDPFWDTHFPPWDWGCRCRVRGINPDLLDQARQHDRRVDPHGDAFDRRIVIEGPALERLRAGQLIRDGRAYDVSKREGPGVSIFQWHPDTLRIAPRDLQARYSPEQWITFEVWARKTLISPGLSVWGWMNGGHA